MTIRKDQAKQIPQEPTGNVVSFPLRAKEVPTAPPIVTDEHSDWLFAKVVDGFGGGYALKHLHRQLDEGKVPAALLGHARMHGIAAARALIDRAHKEAVAQRIEREKAYHAQDVDKARRFVSAMGVTP